MLWNRLNLFITIFETLSVQKIEFSLKLPANAKELYDCVINFDNHKKAFPSQLKNIEIVKNEGIEKHIIFFGQVSDSKLCELYAKAHVFVHLQRIQPFGLVFTEAMSCGTPVIACKPGAPEEVIKDGETGFLINEYNGDELIKFLEIILDNPKQSVEMGIKGRLRVQEKFDSIKQYEKLRKLLLEWIN